MKLKSAGKTNQGMVRSNNEDNIFISEEPLGVFPNVFIVADGMGGHTAGEVASSKAITFFCQYARNASQEGLNEDEPLDALIASVTYANEMTYQVSVFDESLSGMGTTFTVCVILGHKIYIAHVGDSRVYHLAEGKLSRLTSDHTYVCEMIRAGQLTPEAARCHPKRNMLTRALGIDSTLQIDGYMTELHPGDRLLLCSDGLTTMLDEVELYEILKEDLSIYERVDRFIDSANGKGGIDNISVILIDLSKEG